MHEIDSDKASPSATPSTGVDSNVTLADIADVMPSGPGTRPAWLKVSLPTGQGYRKVQELTVQHKLHTVCQSAHCPNIGECWGAGTATFMILGNICTRSCGFCAVLTGKPLKLDEDEPRRVAASVKSLNLRHAVITSVNRDELEDGGARVFANTIIEIHKAIPTCRVEVLIPDFRGDWDALQLILDAKPQILNHNTETVPRLYRRVRPQARYERSLELLERAKKQGAFTKTGIMIGIGETDEEIVQVMRDLREVECDVLTIGQYLQPTRGHLPVQRFVHPEKFLLLRKIALQLGFRYCESGALVRSSYHAEQQVA